MEDSSIAKEESLVSQESQNGQSVKRVFDHIDHGFLTHIFFLTFSHIFSNISANLIFCLPNYYQMLKNAFIYI